MSLSVAPTHLKELLNMVCHKGHSWDLYSSASILMLSLCIYLQILQNVICSRMTPRFIQQGNTLCKLKQKTKNATTLSWMKSNYYTTKAPVSDLSLRPSLNGQNIENVTEHRLLGLTVDNRFRWQAQIEYLCKSMSKKLFVLSQLQHIINIDTRKIFYNVHIKAHVDYASVVRDSCGEVHFKNNNNWTPYSEGQAN